ALADDALHDPTGAPQSLTDFEQKLAKFEADTAALPNGDLKTARQQFAQRARTWLNEAKTAVANGQPVPPLLVTNLDPLFDVVNEQLLVLEALLKSGVIPTTAGPTATRILADVGPDMPTTFNAFFNAVQGMKLVPVFSQSD